MVFWLYGRSGAGKTTLASRLESALRERGSQAFLLDGDELRGGICHDLGFGQEARDENHRRAAEIARLLASRNIIVVVATMAPQIAQREIIRSVLGEGVRWIYVDAPLEVCAARDPKGLYEKASAGKIKQFREFPFDLPGDGELDLHLPTDNASVEDCFLKLLEFTNQELSAG